MGWGGRNQILWALKNCVLIITWQKGDDCYFNTFVSKTNPTNMWSRFFSNRLWSLRKTQSTKERRDTSQGTRSWGVLWCLCTFVWCLCLFLLSRMQKWGSIKSKDTMAWMRTLCPFERQDLKIVTVDYSKWIASLLLDNGTPQSHL